METTLQDRPVCPHCGYQHDDAWEWDFGPGLDGNNDDMQCYRCDEKFDCERIVDVRYTTTAKEGGIVPKTIIRLGAKGKPIEPRCPGCRVKVARPKCVFELGSACPRHELLVAYREAKRRYGIALDAAKER